MDGTEAAGIILKDHDIPVIFLSGHTEPAVVNKTERITSYGYVVKSSSITVLDASIKMAFKLFDAGLVVNYVSPNIERIFGWKPEDVVGRDVLEMVHPEDLPAMRSELVKATVERDSSRTMEYRCLCKDGSHKVVEVTVTNLIDDPTIQGILLSYHDISRYTSAGNGSLVTIPSSPLRPFQIRSAKSSIRFTEKPSRTTDAMGAVSPSLNTPSWRRERYRSSRRSGK